MGLAQSRFEVVDAELPSSLVSDGTLSSYICKYTMKSRGVRSRESSQLALDNAYLSRRALLQPALHGAGSTSIVSVAQFQGEESRHPLRVSAGRGWPRSFSSWRASPIVALTRPRSVTLVAMRETGLSQVLRPGVHYFQAWVTPCPLTLSLRGVGPTLTATGEGQRDWSSTAVGTTPCGMQGGTEEEALAADAGDDRRSFLGAATVADVAVADLISLQLGALGTPGEVGPTAARAAYFQMRRIHKVVLQMAWVRGSEPIEPLPREVRTSSWTDAVRLALAPTGRVTALEVAFFRAFVEAHRARVRVIEQ